MRRQDGTDDYVPGHGDASFAVAHYDLELDYKVAGNRLSGEATPRCSRRAGSSWTCTRSRSLASTSTASPPATLTAGTGSP